MNLPAIVISLLSLLLVLSESRAEYAAAALGASAAKAVENEMRQQLAKREAERNALPPEDTDRAAALDSDIALLKESLAAFGDSAGKNLATDGQFRSDDEIGAAKPAPGDGANPGQGRGMGDSGRTPGTSHDRYQGAVYPDGVVRDLQYVRSENGVEIYSDGREWVSWGNYFYPKSDWNSYYRDNLSESSQAAASANRDYSPGEARPSPDYSPARLAADFRGPVSSAAQNAVSATTPQRQFSAAFGHLSSVLFNAGGAITSAGGGPLGTGAVVATGGYLPGGRFDGVSARVVAGSGKGRGGGRQFWAPPRERTQPDVPQVIDLHRCLRNPDGSIAGGC